MLFNRKIVTRKTLHIQTICKLTDYIPFKASKKHPLTEEQKAFNTRLSKLRVAIEHINRELKIFRICKETYRGKGKRGLLRVKLIASFLNLRRFL